KKSWVDSGSCGSFKRVRQDRNVTWQRLGADERKPDCRPTREVGSFWTRTSQDDRMNPKPDLVNEPVLDQGEGHRAEPVLHNVHSRLLFEGCDLGHEIVAHDRGV